MSGQSHRRTINNSYGFKPVNHGHWGGHTHAYPPALPTQQQYRSLSMAGGYTGTGAAAFPIPERPHSTSAMSYGHTARHAHAGYENGGRYDAAHRPIAGQFYSAPTDYGRATDKIYDNGHAWSMPAQRSKLSPLMRSPHSPFSPARSYASSQSQSRGYAVSSASGYPPTPNPSPRVSTASHSHSHSRSGGSLTSLSSRSRSHFSGGSASASYGHGQGRYHDDYDYGHGHGYSTGSSSVGMYSSGYASGYAASDVVPHIASVGHGLERTFVVEPSEAGSAGSYSRGHSDYSDSGSEGYPETDDEYEADYDDDEGSYGDEDGGYYSDD